MTKYPNSAPSPQPAPTARLDTRMPHGRSRPARGSGHDGVRILAFALTLACGIPAAAATRIWDGGAANDNWTTAQNWVGDVAPVANDSLWFPSTVSQQVLTNNFPAGTVFDAIQFDGDYQILGNAFTLKTSVVVNVSGAFVSIYVPVAMSGLAPAIKDLQVARGATLELHGIVSYLSPDILSDSIKKSGQGTLRLFASNTSIVNTWLSAGDTHVYTANSLGPSGNVSVDAGASLHLRFAGTFSNHPMWVDATTGGASTSLLVHETSTWPGSINIDGSAPQALFIDVDATKTLTLTGSLSGKFFDTTAGLTKTGSGQLILTGAQTVKFLGLFSVLGGLLELDRNSTAVPAGLSIGDGLGAALGEIVRLTAHNQIEGNVTIDGGWLDLNGKVDVIGALTMDGGKVSTGAGTLTLGGTVTSGTDPAAPTPVIEGSVNLGGVTRTFDVGNTATIPDLDVTAILSNGGVRKTGIGRLRLAGANTYAGETVIEGGGVDVSHASALGSTAAGTRVLPGAALMLRASVTGEALSAESGTLGLFTMYCDASGVQTWSGPVTIASHFRPGNFANACTLRLTGPLLGGGPFLPSSTSPNGIEIAGAGSYGGSTEVGGLLRLNAANRLPDASPVRIYGTLDLNGFNETLTPDVINFGSSGGAQILLGGGTLTLATPAGSATFPGVISGTGGLVLNLGPRSLTLSGANTYTGPTTVNSGTLSVTGSLVSAVALKSNAILFGNGTVGAVTSTGGVVYSFGILETQAIVLDGASTATFVLNGAGPGVGHTQLKVTGTVTLGSAALLLTGTLPSTGSFTIIDNDGGDAVAGTFQGLAEGAAITTAGATYRITYSGGDGNDVVLTIANAAPTATAVNITGTPKVGQLLTGSYTYSDAEGDVEGVSTFRWLRNGAPIGGATATTYTTTSEDSGTTITFEVTPKAVAGALTGAPVKSTGLVIENSAPTATAVSITGTPKVGQLLTGSSAYGDVDGDAQGVSTFRWLRGGSAIPGATAATYTTVDADGDQSIAFEVTPVAAAGASPGAPVVSAGVAIEPNTRVYYLTEGATGPFFDLDILLANPNAVAAPVTLTFLKEDGSTVVQNLVLPATSRTTVAVDGIAGIETAAVSTVVNSTSVLPLVVERSMFWDTAYYGSHGGTAVASPGTKWYFGEGSQGFFDTYLLLANASATGATVTVTFLTEFDGPVVKQYTVTPTTRLNVYAGAIPELVGKSFSIVVDSTTPIIAERAMYFGAAHFWDGGHESAGVPAPSTSWFHAEGATGSFFDTYILVGNPNATPAAVTFTFLTDAGTTVVRTKIVPANARLTVNVETEDPLLASTAVSTTVTADVPVISERAMYWPGPYTSWTEAHNSFGVTETATKWGLAEGRVGGPQAFETYVLLANPTAASATVQITYLRTDGTTVVKNYAVAPTSRFNVHVNGMVPELANESFGAVIASSVPIAVERAMYNNAGGTVWAAGTNATATKLP